MLNFEIDNLIEEVENGIEKESLISKLRTLSNEAEWLEQKKIDLIVDNERWHGRFVALLLVAIVGWIL